MFSGETKPYWERLDVPTESIEPMRFSRENRSIVVGMRRMRDGVRATEQSIDTHRGRDVNRFLPPPTKTVGNMLFLPALVII